MQRGFTIILTYQVNNSFSAGADPSSLIPVGPQLKFSEETDRTQTLKLTVEDPTKLQVLPGQSSQAQHNVASWLIHDIVFDERTEIIERLIDTLSWFGDGAFEHPLSPSS